MSTELIVSLIAFGLSNLSITLCYFMWQKLKEEKPPQKDFKKKR